MIFLYASEYTKKVQQLQPETQVTPGLFLQICDLYNYPTRGGIVRVPHNLVEVWAPYLSFAGEVRGGVTIFLWCLAGIE